MYTASSMLRPDSHLCPERLCCGFAPGWSGDVTHPLTQPPVRPPQDLLMELPCEELTPSHPARQQVGKESQPRLAFHWAEGSSSLRVSIPASPQPHYPAP